MRKKPSICVITLTYNRPEYIQRSFKSLYERAGMLFDHYVFDDASDKETTSLLQSLQAMYGFTLLQNTTTLGIFKNFHKNICKIPLEYDYYVKFDSDIEILSDNLFAEMIEVFDLRVDSNVSGVTPRVEGVYNSQRSDEKMGPIQFYNGHAIHVDAPVVYGCCLMFAKRVIEAFPRMNSLQLNETTQQWAIDSMLYEHSLKFGKFMIMEDLSVYHIDNTYGQRKYDMNYFMMRNRWGTTDIDEVWFLRLSKEIYPAFLDKAILQMLKRSSGKYKTFLSACKSVLTHGLAETDLSSDSIANIRKATESIEDKIVTIFKVSAPPNFVKSKNLKKGNVEYYREIPDWVQLDSGVVVENVKMIEKKARELIDITLSEKKK